MRPVLKNGKGFYKSQYLFLSKFKTINHRARFFSANSSLFVDKRKISTNLEFPVCQTFSCNALSDKRVQVRLQQAAAAANVGASHSVNKNQDNV